MINLTNTFKAFALTAPLILGSITTAHAESLTPPTAVTAASKPAAVSVSFKPAANISNYEVRCTSATGKTSQVSKVTTDANTQEVLLTKLSHTEPYACSVRSSSNNQYSPWVSANPGILTPTPLALPSTPGKITVQPLVGALRLTFASSTNAAEYQVTCVSKGEQPVTVKQAQSATPTQDILINLKTVAQACNVIAINNAGESKPSIAPTATPLTPKLQTPSNVSVTPSDQSATVSFTPVASANYYVLYCASKQGKNVEIPNALSSPVTVTGLTNNVAYICSVRAVQKNVTPTGELLDTSLWGSSPSFTPNPPKQVPPLPPRIISASPVFDPTSQSTKVVLNITYDPNGGTPITYSATCVGVTDPTFTATIQSASPVTLTLPADKSYKCQAIATNALGSSAPSAQVDVKTAPIKLSPDILSVKTSKKKDYTVDATFTVSQYPGATAYRVTCISDDKTVWRPSNKTTTSMNLSLGRWSCTTSAQVQGAMTPESQAKYVSVAPPKPVIKKTSDTSVRLTRPLGWKSSWLATCRSDIATAARAGKTTSITLDLPKGSYQCRVYLDGVPSDTVTVKL